MMLEPADRTALLELARRSMLEGCAEGAPRPIPCEPWSAALRTPRATFVTLKRSGALRGCRGTLEPRRILAEDVWHNAWASANTDPRFPPISRVELETLDVAISVLSPLQPLSVTNEAALIEALRPGLDGLVLRYGGTGATFLPAVWEMLPDPREFVAQLKIKAGWMSSFWSAELTVLRYSVETFHSGASPAAAVSAS